MVQYRCSSARPTSPTQLKDSTGLCQPSDLSPLLLLVWQIPSSLALCSLPGRDPVALGIGDRSLPNRPQQ